MQLCTPKPAALTGSPLGGCTHLRRSGPQGSGVCENYPRESSRSSTFSRVGFLRLTRVCYQHRVSNKAWCLPPHLCEVRARCRACIHGKELRLWRQRMRQPIHICGVQQETVLPALHVCDGVTVLVPSLGRSYQGSYSNSTGI